jgi:signal transduction histidine kinase/DNA-binding response OmpR family regulator
MRRKAEDTNPAPAATPPIQHAPCLQQSTLEQQNEDLREELRLSQCALEVARARTFDLYAGSASELRVELNNIAEGKSSEESIKAHVAEVEAARQRAESANQAKTTFLSIMSHELRVPLHTILGYTRLVVKDLRRHGESGAVEKLAIVERSGMQLLQLIDEVLAVSRGGPDAVVLLPEVASLHALVGELESSGKLLAVQGHNQFRIVLAEGVADWVEIDPLRLMRVLHNLVANACKYTAYGAVTLRIDALPAATATCRLRFEVEDNGRGIAAQDLQRIFEPFNRLPGTEHQPGVGLGLPIARQWVQAMGSDIELQSTPGQGSRFFFTLSLPLGTPPIRHPAPDTRHPRPSASINGHAGVQRSVLVVDDNADHRLLLRAICRRWGFRVELAEEGAEALAVCQRAKPAIDAVLIDQFIPKMNGWEFLRAVREDRHLATLPVTLISGAAAKRPTNFPTGIDFDALLMKPVDQDALAENLRRQLNLRWLFDGVAAEEARDTSDELRPPDALLEEFARRLESGEVLAIERWARQLAATHPEFSAYSRQVERCCRQVDLAGLSRLLKERIQDD